ncbi:PPE domain-containing protein [Mycolicibacterium mageritense]|uniref:PPE domain-containing protein n=1 Tax=Mycolicibacterium mageritense TaxID=53462 RepID=UPI0011DADD13|nr:PPE domain-containing protein [Mycolicibacterium mageritense]TXI55755.1 MAG: PPE domain-containing protein [Mycolicibacterium mageritense]
MPFPWPATPPEIAHQLLSSGDQSQSFLATSIALKELATLMGVDATTMSTNAAATAPEFVGLAGIKSLVSANTYAPLAATGSGWLAAGSGVVDSLVGSYNMAKNSMTPAPVALATRESAEAWAAANWHGFFTPIVTSLYELYGNQWVQNAAAGTGWETAVFSAAGPLGIPAPVAPVMANPAGMASEAGMVAANAAESPASAAMRRSYAGVQEALTKTAGVPGGTGMESVSSLMSLASTPMQMVGGLPQMFGQLPQTLGQFPQMGFGLLGPLLSGSALSAANPANALASATEAARQSAATQSLSNAGLPGGGGGGVGGPGSGTTAPLSTFSRPASSFSPVSASAPRITATPGAMPGGPGGATSGTGGGGLFAPPMAHQNRRDGNGNAGGHPTTVTLDGERND